jgi:hypothetical protein
LTWDYVPFLSGDGLLEVVSDGLQDVNIEYYKQKEAQLYATKVARLLMAADEGKVKMFQGKKLIEMCG